MRKPTVANDYKQMQAELERLGYEPNGRNAKNGENWEHPSGHSLVLYSSIKEHQRLNILRDIHKRLGIKAGANKRNVEKIKDRQAKQRETEARERAAHAAWLENHIREIETAGAINGLTNEQRQMLNARLRELAELRQLMSQTPTG